jgi:hypothetical protein
MRFSDSVWVLLVHCVPDFTLLLTAELAACYACLRVASRCWCILNSYLLQQLMVAAVAMHQLLA